MRLIVVASVAACGAVAALLNVYEQPRAALDPALPSLPQVTAPSRGTPITLRAEAHPAGTQALSYNGAFVPPVLRVSPGGEIRVQYVNALPVHTTEMCALGPCTDMTNLHFHGMDVSPDAPQDDVLTMMAMPGQTLHYDVHVPADHPPGLYWYHTHPHGESDREDLDGMSGAIVVEGMDRYVPEVRGLPERILVLRTTEREERGAEHLTFTVNGVVRPSIAIAPGQRQFWRILNASADTYTDLAVDEAPLHVVALDGVPLAYHDPAHPSRTFTHILVPPAGRVEAIVTGPAASKHHAFRTLGVNSGPSGDPMPAQVLADLSPTRADSTPRPVPVENQAPIYKPVGVANLERSKATFVVTFTEGNHRFYINGRAFEPNARPMTKVRVGTYVHWRIVNKTDEIHPFHIHQVHFLTYAVNGKPVGAAAWQDTVNVPVRGTLDVILDATSPVIRGMSVFHCHILSHEDKGMMAKVLFF